MDFVKSYFLQNPYVNPISTRGTDYAHHSQLVSTSTSRIFRPCHGPEKLFLLVPIKDKISEIGIKNW